MERRRIRNLEVKKRGRRVISNLMRTANPQHGLRTLGRFKEIVEAKENIEEKIPVSPGQIQLWSE